MLIKEGLAKYLVLLPDSHMLSYSSIKITFRSLLYNQYGMIPKVYGQGIFACRYIIIYTNLINLLPPGKVDL